MPILETWRGQTFLGKRCTIGEDRAFTNLVLQQGYWTVYQRSAVVYTAVPETYRGLYRMLIRWDRSNFRESLVQLTYMFTRYRSKNQLLPIVDFFLWESEFLMTCIYLPLLLFSLVGSPPALARFISGVGLVSFALTFYYIRQERDIDFVYGIVYTYNAFFFLRWVKPYAFLTLRNGGWVTR